MAGAHDAGIDYGVLAADIAADNMAAHIAAILQSADAVMGGQQPDRGGMTMPDAPFKYEPQGPLPGGAVPMAPGGPAAQPQPYRQLKVEDALAYLDQVKMKFEKQPQIYNKFLDIMKEFKAQSIDTPGVIDRVLNLFFGHRELILGFNTFLPPGYKIEFSEDENKPRVQLKYPPGMTGPQPQGFAQMNAAHAAAAVQAQVQQPVPLSVPHGAAGVGPVGYDRMGGQPMDTAPPGRPAAPANKKAPIEFDQAINYVTKIKTRFAKQPEAYKAFVEILHTYQKESYGCTRTKRSRHTYQKEQKTIKEVYEQVSHLFKSHTDLLSEFSQFLPDGSPEAGGLLGGTLGGSKMTTGRDERPQVDPVSRPLEASFVDLGGESQWPGFEAANDDASSSAILGMSSELMVQPDDPVPGAHDAGIDYGVLAADIAADNMAAHIAAVLQSAAALMGGQQPDRG